MVFRERFSSTCEMCLDPAPVYRHRRRARPSNVDKHRRARSWPRMDCLNVCIVISPQSQGLMAPERDDPRLSLSRGTYLKDHELPRGTGIVLIIIVRQASRNRSKQKLSLTGTNVIESRRYVHDKSGVHCSVKKRQDGSLTFKFMNSSSANLVYAPYIPDPEQSRNRWNLLLRS